MKKKESVTLTGSVTKSMQNTMDIQMSMKKWPTPGILKT